MTTGEPRPEIPPGSVDARRTNTPDDLQELLTIEEVAALLKVSRSWVYEHTRSRNLPRTERLPHVKVGKYVRFEPRALRAFIEQQCRTAT